MKKILFLLFAGLLLSMATNGKTMFVHHGGDIDVFFTTEVDSITYSNIGLDGSNHSSMKTQEIWTTDTVYRYEVSNVDSISFVEPEIVAKENAIDLTNSLTPFIKGDDYTDGIRLFLSAYTPSGLLPGKDNLLYQLQPSDKLANGFAAKVLSVSKDANGYTVICKSAEPEEIFDKLVWEGKSTYCIAKDPSDDDEAGVEKNIRKSVNLVTLVAEMKYPDIISGSVSMDDKLRDIPAGPKQPEIKSTIKINPEVDCDFGIYILPVDDGYTKQMRHLRMAVKSHVSGSASGRRIIDSLNTVSSHSNATMTLPLGLGLECKLSYKGSMKLKGTMGLDYSFDFDYNSSASTTVKYDDYGVTDAVFDYSHLRMKKPVRKLDASMAGEISISGSLTFSILQNTDSLKSISNVFTYGSKLEGDALFLNSDIEKARTDNSLYRKITSGGVRSSDISNITGTYKHHDNTTKINSKIPQDSPVVFYAVPKLSNARWNPSTKTISYDVEGTPMEFASSRMGICITPKSSTQFSWYTSNYSWPGNCTDLFEMKVDYDAGSRRKIYPTVTLPSGDRILAVPEYPDEYNIFPISSSLEKEGIRMTSGAVIFGSGKTVNSSVNAGNIFPYKSPSESDSK